MRTRHRKRVTPEVVTQVSGLLRPGDVLITRHDHALTNLFLPGFWPHGALHIGTETQRAALGLTAREDNRDPVRFLEARKDGVLYRPIEETFHIDNFAVIRPHLDDRAMAEALARAMTHAGKQFDFEFNFSRADRIVCTELVYRAFDGVGGLDFRLTERGGRVTLSAEDLLDRALAGDGFEPVAVYVGGVLHLEDVARHLAGSYRALDESGT